MTFLTIRGVNKDIKSKRIFADNHVHDIFILFDVWANFAFASGLQLIIKTKLQHKCFSVKFAKFLRALICTVQPPVAASASICLEGTSIFESRTETGKKQKKNFETCKVKLKGTLMQIWKSLYIFKFM